MGDGAGMRTITRLALPALLSSVLLACGGGAEDDDGIASLGGDGPTTTEPSGGGGGGRTGVSAEFQDAMLEYAECMRDQGIDFPDPQSDGNGVVVVGPEPGDEPPTQAELDEMEDADAECRHILEDVEGALPEPSPEEQQEMQDRALEFAECMRDHGIDFPDPTFGEGGEVRVGFGASGGDAPDFSDPEFQDAQEECMGDTGFGVGAAPVGSAEEE
jgi:hypothetical protein